MSDASDMFDAAGSAVEEEGNPSRTRTSTRGRLVQNIKAVASTLASSSPAARRGSKGEFDLGGANANTGKDPPLAIEVKFCLR